MSLKVGIVQSRAVFMDLQASLEKAENLVRECAKQGAKLVVFGETWLPGYPAWLDYCTSAALWNHRPTKDIYAELRWNSLDVESDDAQILGRAARDNGVVLVIGINERVEQGQGNGTLYNSLLTFDSDGTLLNHHRKLIPTYTERLVWGQGYGEGLKAVETSIGPVGGLICWEHWMPLTRQVLHMCGEKIHVAVWPTVHEMHQIASRHYAFEGRCFVLAAGNIMPVSDIPSQLQVLPELAADPTRLLLKGGSAIIAPDGRYIVDPVYDEEAILIAEIDLAEVNKEQMTLDVSGHYHRPDLFNLEFRAGGQLASNQMEDSPKCA
jgi:nitrilase